MFPARLLAHTSRRSADKTTTMSIFNKISSTYRLSLDELIDFSSKKVIKVFSEKSYAGYCKAFSAGSYLLYYEWILRHYQASKNIVLSSLFFTQAEYLLERKTRNLKRGHPLKE
jgi:hypothetical protein